jgi:Rrf2 family iron-sulfur cluster assembly transcriptional regulator
MDLIRRNTDYAIRAMVYLAKNRQKEPMSARKISDGQNISYGLACKLLQRLQKNRLVKSTMGPKGGFCLNRESSKINLLKIIEVIQGPVSLNRCQLYVRSCPFGKNCPVRKELKKLQSDINSHLRKLTLTSLIGSTSLATFRKKQK